TSEDSAVYYC
nr:immunoglobulin heavy chain junction region [Mus musculus]